MRSIAVVGSAAALLVLAGCAMSALGSGGAEPPSSAPSAPDAPLVTGPEAQALLADLPAPSATEPALAIGTVLDRDGGQVLCLGPVAESAPPQCDGPDLVGWDWSLVDHQEISGVRWVQGIAAPVTYDAASGTATVAGELLDLGSLTMPAIEYPTGDLDEAQIAAISEDLATLDRPDLLGHGDMDGVVVLDVVLDDGSIQAALDDIYGEGAVFVVSALR